MHAMLAFSASIVVGQKKGTQRVIETIFGSAPTASKRGMMLSEFTTGGSTASGCSPLLDRSSISPWEKRIIHYFSLQKYQKKLLKEKCCKSKYFEFQHIHM
jgi:hypothetical protein